MPPGKIVSSDPAAHAEHVTTPERLFSEETVLVLLNAIRWAMGYHLALKQRDPGVTGMMDSVARERPDRRRAAPDRWFLVTVHDGDRTTVTFDGESHVGPRRDCRKRYAGEVGHGNSSEKNTS
jgi:hypothetical protein